MITIIPAIDIIDGQCVRLRQGDYSQSTVYSGDPLAVAQSFEAVGVRRLHVVDLDGAKSSEPQNLDILCRIACGTNLDIEWGGGVKSRAALEMVFGAGATRAICGSVALTNPAMVEGWIEEFGAERIILGADIKNGFVATHGWTEGSKTTIDEILGNFAAKGLSRTVVTDVAKDGMLEAPNFELYERLAKLFPRLRITVSGGVSSLADVDRLNQMGLDSVIVGKAIYEGRITLKDLERWLANA
ncbi:MAG: 1-(5-phosphoribosyl)-5-[(5-phosphoribosylamino)methylideneamino]imidazole-4-carboxamide isomerase [Mucinivorans sp.]